MVSAVAVSFVELKVLITPELLLESIKFSLFRQLTFIAVDKAYLKLVLRLQNTSMVNFSKYLGVLCRFQV